MTEFKKGEIIQVRDHAGDVGAQRIFVKKEGDLYVCVAPYEGLEFSKTMFLSGEYLQNSWKYAQKYKGEIVKEKVLITDKMIEDFANVYSTNINDINHIKKDLQERGYEVEKPKSKLDEAREYYKHIDYVTITTRELKDKYEDTIKELQEEIERLKK